MFEFENSEKIVKVLFKNFLWPSLTSDDLGRPLEGTLRLQLWWNCSYCLQILLTVKNTRNALERNIPDSTTLQLATLYSKKPIETYFIWELGSFQGANCFNNKLILYKIHQCAHRSLHRIAIFGTLVFHKIEP